MSRFSLMLSLVALLFCHSIQAQESSKNNTKETGGEKITVKIKSLTGNVIEIKLTDDKTIKDLKDLIQTKEGIKPKQQRLIFKGKQLEDESTLQSNGIKHESIVYIVLKYN